MHNLRYALRTLAKSPGFAFTAILTLAVGIGASTAIFTTVDAVLLHPLPYPNASQLVQVTKNMPKFELFKSDASALDFIDYRDRSRSFSHMAAMQTNSVNLTGDAEPVRVYGLRVGTSLFPMLGGQPIEGRVFGHEEEQLGKNRVAGLGEGLWKSRFGADPHIIGKQIEIDTQKFTVIGVVDTAQDSANTPRVAIIDETFAKAFFPKGDAVGQFLIDPFLRLRPGEASQIVGIVGGVKDRNLMKNPQPVIYHPAWQAPLPFMNLAVRTAGDPLALVSAIQQRVRDLDRNLPVYKIATMEQNLSDSLMRRRFSMLLLAALAGFALCLAAVGLYSVISYSVGRRTREIGIRMALGAQPGSVHQLILRQGLRPVLAGLAAGLLASLVAMRALASLLYGVTATDPPTFLAVAGVLLAVSALACAIPARRAALVDPMAALRHE